MRYAIVFSFLSLVLFGCICLTPPLPDTSPTPDGSCNSNSDCDYDERCRSGICVTVECTSDSNCGDCERCSGNQCVSCGRGPYGCYC